MLSQQSCENITWEETEAPRNERLSQVSTCQLEDSGLQPISSESKLYSSGYVSNIQFIKTMEDMKHTLLSHKEKLENK